MRFVACSLLLVVWVMFSDPLWIENYIVASKKSLWITKIVVSGFFQPIFLFPFLRFNN